MERLSGVGVGQGAMVGMDTRFASSMNIIGFTRNKVILPTPHVHLSLSRKVICHEVICNPFPAHCTLYKMLISIKTMDARSNFDLISKIGDTTTRLYIGGRCEWQ